MIKSLPFSNLIADLSNSSGDNVILYLEGTYNQSANDYLSKNYLLIQKAMTRSGNQFVYLPKLLENQDFVDGLNYYLPGISLENSKDLIQNVYRTIQTNYSLDPSQNCFLKFSENGSEVEYWYPVNEKMLYIDSLINLPALKPLRIQYSKYPKKVNYLDDDLLLDDYLESVLGEPVDVIQPNKTETSDDAELINLQVELKAKINRLIQIGGLDFVVQLLQKQLKVETKLSPILVDRNYRIWLTDYQKEIKMPPLSKIVYILYLKHPEGLAFSELSDYRHELLDMYKNISNRLDVDALTESVNQLVDPTENRLNEKVSLIPLAFRKELDATLINPYLILGERGEKRAIHLDRHLIRLEI